MKQLVHFLICLFSVISVTTYAQTYSGGSGAETDPYLISSKADLSALATAVNGGNKYSGKYFLLTQDITEEITTVIGNSSNYFSGIFDGGGREVKLKITSSAYAGLFGYVNNATIKNVGVSGSVSSSSSSSSSSYAGGICGSASSSTITDCYNTGSVSSSSSSSSSSSYAGGICGSASSSTITDCYNTGSVSSSSSSSSSPSFAGGICGSASSSTITNCYNTGSVSSSSSYYSSEAGGICGRLSSSSSIVSNCIAANESVKGSSSSTGRIVGYVNGGSMKNNYASPAMLVNGARVSSTDATSRHGEDYTSINTCSKTSMRIILLTYNPIKWQRSSDNANTWSDIACTELYYTEENPSAGTYIYRAQNGDATYSDYVTVHYSDAVPATINTLPVTNTKTVDESLTFTLELTDDNYSYQWYRNDVAIAGATSATYSIDVIKATHEGNYYCRVYNGCNSTNSKTSSFVVNKSPQVITFDEIPAKTYGDEAFYLPELTNKGLTIVYQSTNNNVATIEGNKVIVKNPGTTTIIATQAGTADYLLAETVERTLTVNKQNQVIAFSAFAAKTYGDPTTTLPAVTDKGLTIAYQSTNTQVATVVGNILTVVGAGEADIIASQAGDAYRYAATPVVRTLTVNKSSQNITFPNFETKTYGDANIVLNQYSDAGLEIVYTSSNSSVAEVDGHVVKLKNAGTAEITAVQSGNVNYASANPVTRTLTIQKANQAIVWSHIDPKVYGDDDFYLPQYTDKGLAITYSSADENVVTVAGNKVTIVNTGSATITATQSGNDNYKPAQAVTLPVTVSKAFQTIVFDELAEKTYGNSNFTLSATNNSGITLVYESSNTNVATVSGNTVTITGAGETYITAYSSGNNNYYSANPVQRLLKVKKASQAIELAAVANRTYGDASFALAATVSTGLPVVYKSSDPANLFVSGNTALILGAGTFTITAEQAGNNNYLPVSDSKTFTVHKAGLVITANNKERFYGDANPALDYSFSGFVNGDSKADLQTLPDIRCDAALTSPAGEYDIVVSGAKNDNYSFTYRNGKLNVRKTPLTVKANDVTRKYGESNPQFTIGYSGFKNNEDFETLTGVPVAVTNAKATSSVGVYDIFVNGGSAINYDFIYEAGKLTIEKAIVNVIADNQERMYGDTNPNLTYYIENLKNDDNLNDIDKLPAVYCNANNTTSVGEYGIVVEGAEDSNYDFAYFNGKLTVKKALLSVAVSNETKEYGDANPTFRFTYSGFKNNETESVLSKKPSVTTAINQKTDAGVYTLVAEGGVAGNYYFNYQSGLLTIHKANLTITADNKTKVQGENNPFFTLSYSGFKNGENESVLDQLPSVVCYADRTSPVGFYDIILSGGSDTNYNCNLVNGKLEVVSSSGIDAVSKADIKIYPNPAKEYLYVDSENQIDRIELYTQTGNVVLLETNFVDKVDVSSLPEGVYLLRIHTNNEVVSRKVIVKR